MLVGGAVPDYAPVQMKMRWTDLCHPRQKNIVVIAFGLRKEPQETHLILTMTGEILMGKLDSKRI